MSEDGSNSGLLVGILRGKAGCSTYCWGRGRGFANCSRDTVNTVNSSLNQWFYGRHTERCEICIGIMFRLSDPERQCLEEVH
eukprot:557008-Amphidinium_carterae.1